MKQAHLKVGAYWHVFPTYREGKDAIWRDPNMLFNIIPKQLIASINHSELVVYFKNGSYYQIKGADNPDSLRGAGPYGLVLDEYDTMKPDVWGILEPIVRANGGWVWFIGTPKGKKQLFEAYQKGQENHNEWKSWRLKATESGIIPLEQLEESKKSMSAALFNQEWQTEFLEGEGSVFRNVRDIATALPAKPIAGHYYTMGVDLAKVQDFTVVSVWDRTTNAQVYQDRYQMLEWPYQKQKIASIARHYNNALVMLDATGLGDPVADDLLRDGLAVQPIKLTSESKKELIEKLSIYIEQKRIAIIPLQETLFEYDNFSYEIGPTGKIRYQARDGFHDDIVISHALGVWDLQPMYAKPNEGETTQIRSEFIKRLKGDYGTDNAELEYEPIE